MACKFSCSLKFSNAFRENNVAVYQPDNCDEFKVKYKSNVCRDLLMNIEWTIPKQVLVTVKLFGRACKKCFASKGAVVNGRKIFLKLRGAFNVSGSPDYTIICLISLIPYVKFNNISMESENVSERSDSNHKEKSQELPFDERCKSLGGKPEVTDCNKNIFDADSTAIPEKEDSLNDCMSSEFSTDCNNSTADNGIVNTNMEMPMCETVASYDGCNEMYTCTEVQSPGTFKNSHCSSSNTLSSYDVQSSNIHTSANSTTLVKTKTCVFLNDDEEFERKINLIEDACKAKIENYNILTSDTIPMEDCPITEIESQESPVDRQSLQMNILDIQVTDNENTNLLIPIHDFEANQTTATETEQMPMEIQESLAQNKDENPDLKCIEMTEDKIFETSTLTKENDETKNETYCLVENQCNNIVLCDLKNEDVEIKTFSLNDVSNKNNCLVDFSKISEKYACVTGMLQKQISVEEPQKDSLVDCYLNSLDSINGIEECLAVESTAIKECSSKCSTIFSPKTDLVSETLIQKLSKDCCLKIGNLCKQSELHTGNKTDKNSKIIDIPKNCFPVMENSLSGLSMDMLDLLMSGDMTDGTLTNGVKEVRIHKAILSARSPVLKDIFISLTRNKMEKCVTIDIPSDVLEDFVVFLYAGLINIKNISMAQILYEVAKKYCINDLLEICLKYL